MAFAFDITDADLEKVFLVEMKPGKEVEGETWTATGSGSYYCSFADGEVVEIKENGSAYTKVASVAACDSTASSFFFDYDNQRLYAHTSGNDSPGTKADGAYKYCLIAYFWLCFTNQQYTGDDAIIFTPQSATHKVYYLPYFDTDSVPTITQAVGEYHKGDITIQFGNLAFLNDGFWYSALENYIFHGKYVEIKLGIKGIPYDDYETIFIGRLRNPSISDETATIEAKDSRIGSLREIPIYKYWISDYTNLNPNEEGRAIPVLFGEKINITPVCIDTTTFKYKICGHGLQSIDAVYKNGVELTLTTDYTVDLNNGEFTLLADPDTALITCDAKGAKISYFGAAAAYSENVANILYYVLHDLNGIADADLDKDSFDDLQTYRTQAIAWYLDTPTPTLEFVRLLQASSVFQLIPTLDGKYAAVRYKSGITESTPRFYSEDYSWTEKSEESEAIYKKVTIRYAKDPSTGIWLAVETSDSKASYRYDEEETLIIETALRQKSEAESLATFYKNLVCNPLAKMSGEVPSSALNLKPSDKIIITKQVETYDGDELSVFESDVYRILEMRKNLQTAKVEISAIEDIQSIGGTETHVNTAHEDSHSDSHTDTAHANVAHSDTTYNDYSDSAHQNTAHTDSHENVAHEDSHSNAPYEDQHWDHLDEILHEDEHSDTAHSDSHSDSHGDEHSNVAHEDVEHSNSSHSDHSDTSHSNIAHENSHSDSHSDTPHEDSQY